MPETEKLIYTASIDYRCRLTMDAVTNGVTIVFAVNRGIDFGIISFLGNFSSLHTKMKSVKQYQLHTIGHKQMPITYIPFVYCNKTKI